MLGLRIEKYRYKTNLCLGIILSIVSVIALFVLSPRHSQFKKDIPFYREPIISFIDIPASYQQTLLQSRPPIPNITEIMEGEIEIEPLDNVEIKNDKPAGRIGDEMISDGGPGNTKILNASSFPFIPRQIVEAVPEEADGARGLIKVNILVGTDGAAKEFKIIENTTNTNQCFTAVEIAIYKSLWQSIKIDGSPIEYWIEKIYEFN